MVTVTRTREYLEHKGKKGMKWGYNDGKRNGKRTAAELKKLQEEREKLAKENDEYGDISDNVERDYIEANNMLKFLGISLDLHSDDEAVAKTMAIYNQMKKSKDKYDNQYDWLKSFSNKLSGIGYDMSACDSYLDENKDQLEKIEKGAGSGNTEGYEETKSSNDDNSSNKKSNDKSSEDEIAKEDQEDTNETVTKTDNSVKKNITNKKKTNNKKKTETKEPENQTDEEKKSYASDSSSAKETKYKKKSSAATAKNYLKMSESQNGNNLTHRGCITMSVVEETNSLMHIGTKRHSGRYPWGSGKNPHQHEANFISSEGPKWGVRRYQNKDGSLTESGKSHYNNSANSINDKVNELSGSKKNNSQDNNTFNKSVNSTVNTARKANKAIDKIEETKYKKKIDKMSNEELEKEIAKALPEYEARVLREQLEQKYNKVVGNNESTKSGREKIMQTLEIIGKTAIVSKEIYDLIKVIKRNT